MKLEFNDYLLLYLNCLIFFMPKKSRCNKSKRGVDVTKYFFGASGNYSNYTNRRASNNSLKIGEIVASS